MQRLNLLSGQVKEPKFLADGLEFYKLYDQLTAEENLVRTAVKGFVEKEVVGKINHYVETATFPTEIVNAAKPYALMKHLYNAPFGTGSTYTKTGLVVMEAAKADVGLATFMAVQNLLLGYTLEKLGSEAQKQKYLKKVIDLEIIGGWGLTEKEFGSDASSIQTTAKKVQGGYLINGNKRWIGNGNKDLVIVWARNTDTNQINGFIVENKWDGVTSEVIKNKLALRIVQNCQITFKDVFVPDENKLEKVTNFQTGPNVVLMHSRVVIPWLAVGLQAGVYENVIKFTTRRRQFGKPIAGFQLQQERIVRILTTLQASFLLALQISRLAEEGKATIGMISSAKAWITERTREVARIGRETMGGDGILMDNYCIKALADAEVIYTYEGTYDINCLVAGREITGLSAFK